MNVFLAITVCAAAVGANVQLDSFRKTYLFADGVWDGARARVLLQY